MSAAPGHLVLPSASHSLVLLLQRRRRQVCFVYLPLLLASIDVGFGAAFSDGTDELDFPSSILMEDDACTQSDPPTREEEACALELRALRGEAQQSVLSSHSAQRLTSSPARKGPDTAGAAFSSEEYQAEMPEADFAQRFADSKVARKLPHFSSQFFSVYDLDGSRGLNLEELGRARQTVAWWGSTYTYHRRAIGGHYRPSHPYNSYFRSWLQENGGNDGEARTGDVEAEAEAKAKAGLDAETDADADEEDFSGDMLDGDMSESQEASQRALMEAADSDGDRAVSGAELIAFIKVAAGLEATTTKAKAPALLSIHDPDGSGSLDFQEFGQAMKTVAWWGDRHHRAAFVAGARPEADASRPARAAAAVLLAGNEHQFQPDFADDHLHMAQTDYEREEQEESLAEPP
eukprot:CAMPEP_0206453416 /NCGR_PEP_ID=MMETSP0324_2-20121206/20532_1 /ASSEMBLY_ACC=CAM_ASM_000836 /TAXON_ID=2866 /ORGANISM="Crypthecodinium cohnii, Strain Seligo" /LENGTH=404 /DNA_ID=CAMNT_0053923701 /DNA_START=56 /DNA_END=1270 /DNA_ORIENTATION=-